MSGPQFPVYQRARRHGILAPTEAGYGYYKHLTDSLPKDHAFNDPNPLRYPPYCIEKMVTEGGKHLKIDHIDPQMPPIYVGSMWDHIPKERFTNKWWETPGNAEAALANLPFDTMWIEFDVPNNRPQDPGPARVPMACMYHRIYDDDADMHCAVVTAFIESNVVPTMDDDTKKKTDMLLPMAVGGVVIGRSMDIPRVGWSPYHWGLAVDCVLDGLNVAGILSQFLNCRNVELVEVLPTTIASNPKKRRKRLSNPARTKYRVVHVEPVQKRKPTLGRSDSPTVAKRQHMRRGHFKTYTPEAPLFGRITGTYWWGPALCGTGGDLEQSWDMSSLMVRPEEVENANSRTDTKGS